MVLEVAASFGFVRETVLTVGCSMSGRSPNRATWSSITRGCCTTRTAFGVTAGSPGRHLQGCYADLDGLASTLAVLRRQENQ